MEEHSAHQLILEQAIGFNVNRTAHLMSEEIARRFRAHGFPLSAQDFGILYLIANHKELTQMEIASLMMRNKTTITRRLNGLEHKQLIARHPSPRDRRYILIKLTAKGEMAMATLAPIVANFQQEVCCGISGEAKQTTIATLKKIIEKLS